MDLESSVQQVTLNWYRCGEHSIIFTENDSTTKYIITFVNDEIVRVRVWPNGGPETKQTWAILGVEDSDVPFEGRPRHEDLNNFHLYNKSSIDIESKFQIQETDNHLELKTTQIKCRIHLKKKFSITWISWDGNVLLRDNPISSYYHETSTGILRHTLSRPVDEDEYYCYGLGEKSGGLDKKFRRYRMRNTDAMGYNAEFSDPLYKHVPFYITLRNDHAIGIFYDTFYDCTFDLGCELDNYYGTMTYFETQDPDLDYYFLNGPSIERVVEQYTNLTGHCPLAPKWTLGYLGSAMKYTDAANAQDMLKKFIDKCSQHQIRCTGFHLSSGYSMNSEDGKRYVFVWDKKRVPSPSLVTENFHRSGMKVLANIKPAMLTTHPNFQKCQSLFIKEEHSNGPDLTPFWGGLAAHLDFTNPETVQWWKEQVKTQLLENGIDCTWNDNNEYNIKHGNARCFNGWKIDAIKPIQTMLMVKASYEAQKQAIKEKRPWLLTRAACPGVQRYAGTWTGDNRCSWNTLKFNIPMGLNLSLSGFPLIGHDVGGFAGEKPSMELFVRWIQNGIFHPRFCVHSWRPNQDENSDDNNENSLWMYEDALPLVHDALNFRRSLEYYLYCLIREAHVTGHPVIRPTVYHFQGDKFCRSQSFEFLLGPWLLVASVYEENATTRTLYLPSGTKWYHFWNENIYDGGQTITVPAALNEFPVFIREGAILPFMNGNKLQLRIYPFLDEGVSEFELYDDDGETTHNSTNNIEEFNLQTIRLVCNLTDIKLFITKVHGNFQQADLWFPKNEQRSHETVIQ